MCAAKLDSDLFFTRLNKFYEFWKNSKDENGLKAVDAVVVINGKEDIIYSKTSSIQMWLFGFELQDTVMIFCKENLYFLSSKKKCEFLRPAESGSSSHDLPNIEIHVRDTADGDTAKISMLMKAIKNSGNGTKVGHFAKDKYASDFVTAVKTALKSSNFEMVDVSAAVGDILSVKDDIELGAMRKASEVTCTIFNKYFREEVMDIIDQDRKVKHAKLSMGCEESLKSKKFNQGLPEDLLDTCYPVIIQSGPNITLKFSVESDKNPLQIGVVVCCVGVRYKFYCTNLIRTLMVNPTEDQSASYEYLVTLYDFALKELKDGVVFSDFYNRIVTKCDKEKPELKGKLTSSFGFLTGIEFRDSSHVIGPKGQSIFRTGMSVNLNIGFQDIENKSSKSKSDRVYSLWVGDVVIVPSGDGEAEVLTVGAKRRTKAISFLFKEDEEGESETEEKETTEEVLGRGHRKAIIEQKTRSEQTSEEKRLTNQSVLFDRLMTESKNRLSGLKTDSGHTKKAKSSVSYKGAGQMPKENDVTKLRLFVDRKYETVILPMFGTPTPFHISTIKNISTSIEGDYTYLRVNFFHPGATIQAKDGPAFSSPESTFLKEITFRAANEKRQGDSAIPSTSLNTAFRLIKEVQKKFKIREAEEREKADLVEQDTLVISQNRNAPKLKDLYIRPNLVSKRITGSLEAHTNGFRFTSIRGDKVDILYNNIKNAIFQPCDKEMIILIHFHLKHAILFGKKKNYDVQFYTEVGEITTDLGKMHHMHDRDDIEAEQRERDMRNKLKSAFAGFCDKVETLTKSEVDFDRPFRELGFYGSPFRSTVLLQPTSGCLVNLTEWPPFIINLNEVEFVYFERVCLSIRNFDMVFIFKDYNKKGAMVNSIPATSLDHVKDWLNSCDIYYMEGTKSLNWIKIMKTIIDDPEGFFDQGGWHFIAPASAESEEENDEDEEDDDEYAPSDDGDEDVSEESSEEEESDEEDWSAEEEEDSDASLDSDESEGKDWDELEKIAAKADAGRSEEDEPETHSKKRPHSSPSKHKSKKSRHEPSPKKHKKHHSPDKKKHHSNPDKKHKKSRH